MNEQRTRRRTLAWWGAGLILAAAALGTWITLNGAPFSVDSWWNNLVGSPSGGAVLSAAMALDRLGGGEIAVFVVPLAVMALLVVLRRRWWGAAFFALSSIASALVVQLLKFLFLRERPEDILVLVDEGSFPSGHTANAATLACALCILIPRRWMYVVGGLWVVAMAFARTYLSAHWPSDTLGGALVGVGAVLVVAAVLDGPLRRERDSLGRRLPPSAGRPAA
jgi:undecaprenyl-diphosphatase